MNRAEVEGLLKYCTTDRQRELVESVTANGATEAALKIIQNAQPETLQ